MPALLPKSYDADVVALSIAMACLASFVALDLARHVRKAEGRAALGWTITGALAMGTGIWSMHFIGMQAMSLPVPLGYAPGLTLLSWVAAVSTSLVALRIATHQHLTLPVLAGGGVVMGAGICAMHYGGMAALDIAPGIQWNAAWVAASVAIACGASIAALLIFFLLRRLRGRQRLAAQLAASFVMGLAIAGMHYAGMAAAGFPEGMICRSAGQLSGQSLGVTVPIAAALVLVATLLSSALDAHIRVRARRLAASLHSARTELQDANAALARRPFEDPLTGLATRPFFDDRLRQALGRAEQSSLLVSGPTRSSAKVAVLFVDLDGFRAINEAHGHGAGDEVIRQMAERLRALTHQGDTLARIGADEFVLLQENLGHAFDAVQTAQLLLASMQKPFEAASRSLRIGCSIGIAVYPDQGERESLLACADAAMLRAKRSGGSGYALYETHMQAGMSEQFDLQQELRTAVGRSQFELHYQPKIQAGTGTVIGVEALLRWRRPSTGQWVSPAVFIPIAERSGLIGPIGDWVLASACRQMQQWREAGLHVCVAVNVSTLQLRQGRALVERVRTLARQHGLQRGQLVCEITESAAMEDTPVTREAIDALIDAGIELSIDDFGTGYSSLGSLRSLRAHELKIDRSFVADVAASADAHAVVDAVVRLAHALGLTVTAEGVETRAQRDALRALGCDRFQGYLFGKPMPAQALEEYLRHVQAQAQRREPSDSIPAELT